MLKNVSVISTYNTDNIAGLEKDFELKKIRRMDFFSKLALKSAVNCLKIADIRLEENKNIGLIIATGYGPVKKTCDCKPDSIVIASHMDAVSHAHLSRDQLKKELACTRYAEQVLIPVDGERIEII